MRTQWTTKGKVLLAHAIKDSTDIFGISGGGVFETPPRYATLILLLSSHLCPHPPSGLYPLGFLTKTLHIFLFSPICATCPAHLILLHLINQIIFGEMYKSWRSSLCNFLQSSVTSLCLGQNTSLKTLFCNTLCPRFFLNAKGQVSHAYKTGKIIVMYISIVTFFNSKWEDRRSWIECWCSWNFVF